MNEDISKGCILIPFINYQRISLNKDIVRNEKDYKSLVRS